MEYTSFDELRRELLKEALAFRRREDINSEFKRKFLFLIERCSLSLMEGEDNFFGLFMVKIKRNIGMNLTWPIETEATLTNFVMTFDVVEILNLSEKEIIALIKHEILHIMYDHYGRTKSLRDKYSPLAVNLAMDISVNQFIKNMPAFSYKIDSVNMSLNLNLNEDQSLESYAYKIDMALKDKIKNGDKNKFEDDLFDMENIHESFLSMNDIKDLSQKTALSSFRNGRAPNGLEDILSRIVEKPEISWSKYLKRVISVYPSGYKKTITRKNRRQPDRLDLRGVLRNHISKILVAIDISGSITDEEIKEILREIFNLIKNNNVKVTLSEIDNEVRRVYEVKNKNDLRPKLDRRGGTEFSPLFKYANNNGFKDHLIIYFTDGMGEEKLTVKPMNNNIIWVLTGKSEKLSLNESCGRVLKLKNSNKYEFDKDLVGIEIAREMIRELDNLNNRDLEGYR